MASDLAIGSSIPIHPGMEKGSLLACADFLESGVTPYVHCQESCSICCNEFTDAIQINRCGHCFDMDCLAAWFASRTKP